MKKTVYCSMAVLVVMGAILSACTKNEAAGQDPEISDNIVTVTTTIGLVENNATKALNIDYGEKKAEKTFGAGEQVALVYEKTDGNKTRAVATAANISLDGKSASFTFKLVNPKASQIVSYHYPASVADDAGKITIPISAQDGSLSNVNLLDYAYAEGALSGATLPASIKLENQFAIVDFTLKNNTAGLRTDITGTITGMTINDGTNDYYITRGAGAAHIYVVMMPFADKTLTITATDGVKNYSKTLSGKTYAKNNFYQQGLLVMDSEKAGNGFTINKERTKVLFSQGNLQATYTDGTWTWAFAEHQWDFIGGWNGTETPRIETSNNHLTEEGTLPANGTVDLFGWVGKSSTWGGVLQYGLTCSEATGNNDGYGSVGGESLKSDWGKVTISNGGVYTWRPLTGNVNGEWDYIFSKRTSGASVNCTANAHYTYATINSDGTPVNGMILFPDGCIIHPSSATWGGIDGPGYDPTSCTTAQWAHLAELGCVFLPAAGYRSKASVVNSVVSGAGASGYYWSSSSSTDNNAIAYSVYFDAGTRDSARKYGRDGGFSVRLVREL